MIRGFARVLILAGIAGAVVGHGSAAAQVIGPPVSVAWDRSTGSSVAGYRVYVGRGAGFPTEVFDVGQVPMITFRSGLAGQRYYFAVTAYTNTQLESPRSTALPVWIATVPVATPPPPPPRTGPAPTLVLRPPTVTGARVALSWYPVGALGAAEYVLEAGTAPGLSNLYTGSVGSVTSMSAVVGGGMYYVRVRARTADDENGIVSEEADGVVSNEVSFAIGGAGQPSCSAPPPRPSGLTGGIAAGRATARWTRSNLASSYIVQAGSAPGLSDLFNGDVGAVASVSSAVGPGFRGWVRIFAVNACGQSPASTETLIQ